MSVEDTTWLIVVSEVPAAVCMEAFANVLLLLLIPPKCVPWAQGMMGTVQQGGGQPTAGAPTTFVHTAPGNLMQSSMMTSEGGNTTRSTTVGADPLAHTTQTYDPTTNTLITTTVDPATGEAG